MLGIQPDFGLVIVRAGINDSWNRDIASLFVYIGAEIPCKPAIQESGVRSACGTDSGLCEPIQAELIYVNLKAMLHQDIL
jgi:hypothetical protein